MQAVWSQNDRSLWLYILALNFRLKVYVDTVAATNLSPRREVKKKLPGASGLEQFACVIPALLEKLSQLFHQGDVRSLWVFSVTLVTLGTLPPYRGSNI